MDKDQLVAVQGIVTTGKENGYHMNTDIHNLQDPLLLKTHFCVKTHVKYKLHTLSPITKSELKEYLLQGNQCEPEGYLLQGTKCKPEEYLLQATQYEPEEYFLQDTESRNKYGVLQGGLIPGWSYRTDRCIKTVLHTKKEYIGIMPVYSFQMSVASNCTCRLVTQNDSDTL